MGGWLGGWVGGWRMGGWVEVWLEVGLYRIHGTEGLCGGEGEGWVR